MATIAWDSVNKGAGVTLSSGNLTASGITNSNSVRASIGKTTGKWYWEIKLNTAQNAMIGVANSSATLNASHFATANSRYYYYDGKKYAGATAYGASYVTGDIISVLLNLDSGSVEFWKNGVSQGVAFTDIKSMGEVFPAVSSGSSSSSVGVTARFARGDFQYSIPDGYQPYDFKPNKTLILLDNGDYTKLKSQENTVPNMTSNTAPSGTVSSSGDFGAGYEAFRVFDGKSIHLNGSWISSSGAFPKWISYRFPSPKKIEQVKIKASVDSSNITAGYSIKSFTIEGKNSADVNWNTLKTSTNETNWTVGEERLYSFTNNTPYDEYRLNIASSQAGQNIVLTEIEMFEAPTWQTITVSKPPTKTDFETYGYDDLSAISESAWQGLCQLSPKAKFVTYVPEGNTSTDIESTTMGKGLAMNALPQPQFIKQINSNKVYGTINEFLSTEKYAGSENGVIRYLLSPDKVTWKTWNGVSFVNIDTSNIVNIAANGITGDILRSLTVSEWDKWTGQKMYLGIYLEEDIRDKTKAHIDSIAYRDTVPIESTRISDAKLYILNTVSTINVEFKGSTITGIIDDEDEGKVQYRIRLNGNDYFPADGSFTPLMASPLNISTTLSNNDIKIDENNILRIEFKDYWGSTDYWETNFVGTYSGLLFLDKTGKYYSTDIGGILQYLDFGVIIAGQTTIEQEILLRNTYGYAVDNINIRANQLEFPDGMKAQFGTNEISFEALDNLNLNGQLEDGDERTFYIRLSTQLGVTPQVNGEFEIIVTADKVNEI